jgi:hypothetical protein
MNGAVSKTPLYRAVYRVSGLLLSLLRKAFPRLVTTTEQLGRAMVDVATNGSPTRVLETTDINKAASA